jgi:hypothetical protein
VSFERKRERLAQKQAKKSLLVTVLNDPSRKMEVPVAYRNNLLDHYGLHANQLVGLGFHIIFVIEGVVFGMITRHQDRARVTLHILELDDPQCKKIVGSEIFDFWEKLPTALTFEELRRRYSEVAGVEHEGNSAS